MSYRVYDGPTKYRIVHEDTGIWEPPHWRRRLQVTKNLLRKRRLERRREIERAEAARIKAATKKRKVGNVFQFPKKPNVRDIWFLGSPEFSRPSLQDITHDVAMRHGLRVGEILSTNRREVVVAARWEAVRKAREIHPDMSYAALGRWFRRDHTTIMYVLGLKYRKVRSTPREKAA